MEKCLWAGGEVIEGTTDAAQLFDPTSGTNGSWSDTEFLHTARRNHTATLLPNGKVLVAGGENEQDDALSSAEIYDPASGKWTETGPLNAARSGHIAKLLPDGRVSRSLPGRIRMAT